MANEQRLIDANVMRDDLLQNGENEYVYDTNAVLESIDAQPTVDAVEVVHGHWCWEGKFKACSHCGSYVEWDKTLGANFWKFCPTAVQRWMEGMRVSKVLHFVPIDIHDNNKNREKPVIAICKHGSICRFPSV